MKKINVLPKEIADKIAAGEVIERPVSVVRELIENSIDAGSKNIRVDIKNAGMKRIAVIDDGEGMDEENLKKCILSHATSKIENTDDLLRIASLGFRGEALSSIGIVGDLTIKSKPRHLDFGKEINVQNGKINNLAPVGMPKGTEVIVEDLFASIPARKKFLKNLNIESRQIVESIIRLAISFPEIGFSHYHNEKEIFKFASDQLLSERIELIFGKEFYNNLMLVDFQSEYFKVKGFLAKPQIANRSQTKQFIFANNRFIKNNVFVNLIKDAYGNFLEARANPMFILFFDFPPESIDINIHPRKEEIKFLNQTEIYKEIKSFVSETLNNEDLSYVLDDYSDDGMEEYTADVLRQGSDFWQVREDDQSADILQIHKTYLAKETKRGLLLIDQHAAHERIIYEELLEKFEKIKAEKDIYRLPEAIVFDLPINEVKLLKDNLETFQKIGIDIEFFGGQTFKINSILNIFKNRDLTKLVMEYLVDLQNGLKDFNVDSKTEKTMAYLACRSAIKAGDYLTQEERRKIIEKLKTTKSNYTCPHGRPAHIEITENELRSMFKRI